MDPIVSLKNLTSKKFIYFFDSGDDAIFYLMKYFFDKGYKNIMIPDCGGWFSYKKFPKKIGLNIIEIKTNDALIDIEDLKSKLQVKSIVMINSMGGYFVSEPMNEIFDACKNNDSILINDVSASIGLDISKLGEFCVGSFGEHKPVELGIGGFLGSDIPFEIQSNENQEFLGKLGLELGKLSEKRKFWGSMRDRILDDLSSNNILHRESLGINVVVAYEDDVEKENLINYCTKHGLECVNCPNYIKVNRKAISIEVKRKK